MPQVQEMYIRNLKQAKLPKPPFISFILAGLLNLGAFLEMQAL